MIAAIGQWGGNGHSGMIIVGEKINSSNKTVQAAIEGRDTPFIVGLARAQRDAGADYVDLNAGIYSADEAERLEWLVAAIQGQVDVRFSLDTSNSTALRLALAANRNGKPLINSITAQKARFGATLPLVLEYNASVVALCIDDAGLAGTADGRIKTADWLVESLTRGGVEIADIYLDPVVLPAGTSPGAAAVAVETIAQMRKRWPDVHIICGLSNISYGLPARSLMNRTFFAAAAFAGLDSVILDPLDRPLIDAIYAAEALTGADDYAMEYIKKYRSL
ncbi:MAG: dihydropteroate synthase [Oscillospiraceae bacterium]|nr:dihydropteroate synthase [Oscillospiraceae bacterium]